jgi:Rv0078B-related antitoxin
VDPETALQRQIDRYRRMTGEERLAIALNLHRLSCDIAREGIRRQFPDADDAQVEAHLRKRIEMGRRLETNATCSSTVSIRRDVDSRLSADYLRGHI